MHSLQLQHAQLQLKAALIAVAIALSDKEGGHPDAVTAHIIVDEAGDFEGNYEASVALEGQSAMVTIAGGSL
jgi:hypothetical protein